MKRKLSIAARDHARKKSREWYAANKERAKAAQAEYRAKYPERIAEYSRKYLYGHIPRPAPECCEACGIPFASTKKGSCVDHNHQTGEFRGWLCNGCNLALGHLKDSIGRVLALCRYLER